MALTTTPDVPPELSQLERCVSSLQQVVRNANPKLVSGDQARAMVALFADAERAAASGIALFSPVVMETGSFAKEGHGSAADWLGALSGSSSTVAKGRLAAAQCAAVTPVLIEALQAGDLSAAQLSVMTMTAVQVPGSSVELLDLLGQGASHQELSDAASCLRAGARSRESERSRRAHVHARRHLRWHQDEGGGVKGEFLCDEVAWARVAPLLEKVAKERWRAAGSSTDADALEAFRLDAFIDLLAGANGESRGKGARGHALVVIDAEALRRGTTQGDEVCEIQGIGPVSVAAATELLTEGGGISYAKDSTSAA